VKIPVLGTIESLNVSVAAGIVMYEAVRQRQKESVIPLNK
jgi:23S rRNA (guanosine2251-2'-O)-methyltransferase